MECIFYPNIGSYLCMEILDVEVVHAATSIEDTKGDAFILCLDEVLYMTEKETAMILPNQLHQNGVIVD